MSREDKKGSREDKKQKGTSQKVKSDYQKGKDSKSDDTPMSIFNKKKK